MLDWLGHTFVKNSRTFHQCGSLSFFFFELASGYVRIVNRIEIPTLYSEEEDHVACQCFSLLWNSVTQNYTECYQFLL